MGYRKKTCERGWEGGEENWVDHIKGRGDHKVKKNRVIGGYINSDRHSLPAKGDRPRLLFDSFFFSSRIFSSRLFFSLPASFLRSSSSLRLFPLLLSPLFLSCLGLSSIFLFSLQKIRTDIQRDTFQKY